MIASSTDSIQHRPNTIDEGIKNGCTKALIQVRIYH